MNDIKIQEERIARRNHIILTAVIFSAYTIFGISESVKGPAIPRMQTDLVLNELQVGVLLAVNALGYLIACSAAAPLTRRFGMKPVLIVSLAVMALSGIAICYSPSFIVLAITFFIMYLGNGALEIALGVSAAIIFTKDTGKMLNLAHGFYGIGAIIGPVMAAGLMAIKLDHTTLGWRYMYMIVLSTALIPIALSLFGKLRSAAGEAHPVGELREYLKNPVAWCVIIILSFGSMCEMGMGGWLANYMEKAKDFSPEAAAASLTGFFLVFTLARLVLAPFIDRIGLVNTLIYSNALACIFIVIGVVIGLPGSFLVIASGIGVAPLYPTVLAIVARHFHDVIDTAMTVTMTAMGIISLPANILLGVIIELVKDAFIDAHGQVQGVAIGYGAGMIVLAICCLIAFLTALYLKKHLLKSNQLI